MDVKVSSSGNQSELTLPGWELQDYRFMGPGLQSFKPWTIFQKVENCKEYIRVHDYLDDEKFNKTRLIYAKCIKLEKLVKQSDFEALGSKPYSYGIKVKSELVNIGRTSFQLEDTVLHLEKSLPLFRCEFAIVSLDKLTKKVASLPEWWQDKYKPTTTNRNVVPLRISFRDQKPGTGSKKCEITHTVRPSDTDYYEHTNHYSYVTIAMDGVLTALQRGLLALNDQKDLEDAIQKMEVDFIADCGLGDELRVVTWTDDVTSAVIWSSIHKLDQVILVQKITLDLGLSHSKL